MEFLQCCLHISRECALSIAEECARQRSAAFNKQKSLREFSVGQQVLLKTPGLIGSLESSWEGPFLVKHKLSRVNYRVTTLGWQETKGSSHKQLQGVNPQKC